MKPRLPRTVRCAPVHRYLEPADRPNEVLGLLGVSGDPSLPATRTASEANLVVREIAWSAVSARVRPWPPVSRILSNEGFRNLLTYRRFLDLR